MSCLKIRKIKNKYGPEFINKGKLGEKTWVWIT